VDRQAADAVTGKFDLAGVAAGADPQPEVAKSRAQRLGTPDGPRGPSKDASRPSLAESI
jgi:hypothetical protein